MDIDRYAGIVVVNERMRILLVGYGKMGQLVGELARQYDCEVAGIVDPLSPAHSGGIDDDRWRDVDVAIDFSSPDAVPTQSCRRSPGAASTSSSGRPAGSRTRRRCGRSSADAGIGIVAAPNFSTGVVLFEAMVAQAAALLAAAGRVRRVAARGASRDEEGRAVGHGAAAEARDGRGRLLAADRRVVDARRVHSGHPHDRLRRPVRIDYADAYGARSQRLRARRAARPRGG